MSKEMINGQEWEVIDSYTNEDALADGVFKPLEIANLFGFACPVWFCGEIVSRMGDIEFLKQLFTAFTNKWMLDRSGDIYPVKIGKDLIWMILENQGNGTVVVKVMYPSDY